MYKQGLMSVLRDRKVLKYLRENKEPNATLVERALRKAFGLSPRKKSRTMRKRRGRGKKAECRNPLPVKISDPDLIGIVVSRRKREGISHRFQFERAVLDLIAASKEKGGEE